jgi:hypothetical protein
MLAFNLARKMGCRWFLLLFSIVVPFLAAVDEFDIENMRTRDLKRFLTKNGADEAELGSIFLKRELKDMALEVLFSKRREEGYASRTRLQMYILTGVAGLLILFMARGLLEPITYQLRNWLEGYRYRIAISTRMVRSATKHKKYASATCLLLAVFLDALSLVMNMSILASWIVPQDWTLRRLLVRMDRTYI